MVLGIVLAFFTILLLRTAWISDAAYLTLRTVEHASEGFGLRWNVAERVQVYDHPLWVMMLLTGRWLTGELYFTTIGISIAASLACLWLVAGQTSRPLAPMAVLGAMVLSPSFVSFSTSGLESPLLHVLVAALAIVWLNSQGASRGDLAFATLAGLAVLTRWTALLLVLPALVVILTRVTWKTRIAVVVLSLGPIVLWSAGAWWYYGTIGPNAWIATEGTWLERIATGRMFLYETFRLDPLLICGLLAGAAVGALSGGRARWLALGLLLLAVWTIASGGSIMAGWGLTAPYVAALLLLAHGVKFTVPAAVLATATGATVLSFAPGVTLFSGADHGERAHRSGRTHDVRRVQYKSTGLLLENRQRRAPVHPEASRAREAVQAGETVAVSTMPGTFGIVAGSSVHVIDPRGVTDPLLARLPAAAGTRWRWSAPRRLPDGYLAHLAGAAALEEAPLAQLDAEVRQVTRAPLTATGRFGAMTGLGRRADTLVAASSYGPARLRWSDLAASPEPRLLHERGLVVVFDAPQTVSTVSFSGSVRYAYTVHLLEDDAPVASATSPRLSWTEGPDSSRHFEFRPSRPATALWILCDRGVGPCTVSDVTLGN